MVTRTSRLTLHNLRYLLLLLPAAGLAGCSSSGSPTYVWHFNVVSSYLPLLFEGLRLTLILTLVVVSVGMFLGIFIAAGRMTKFWPVRYLVTGYIELMRGTPTLVQLVWAYYGLSILLGIELSGLIAVGIALTLNVAAFFAEAFRSGIQSIPKEQFESADVLGLGYLNRMRYVIVPQAFSNVLPVLISLSISLFKDTSLVSTVGVADLMYNGRIVATSTYRPLEILTTVAVIYFLIAFPFTLVMRRLEIRLSHHLT